MSNRHFGGIRGVAATCAVVVLVAGCTSTPDGGGQAPGGSSHAPHALDLTLPSVSIRQDASESGSLQWSVRWPQIDRLTSLNARVESYAKAQLTAFLADNTANEQNPPELAIGSRLARAGDVLAIRFTTYNMPGASGPTSHVTYYGSLTGGGRPIRWS